MTCKEWGIDLTGYDKLVKLIIVLSYYALGAMFYTKNMNWDLTEALYFISVSVTTTGYGQLHCTHNSCKLFTIPYILLGVAIVLTLCNEFAKEVVIKAQEYLIIKFYQKVFWLDSVPLRTMRSIKMYLSASGVILTLFSGALFYSANENWSFLNGFYWVSETITSVGYGDLYIKHDSSRLFGIFYVLFGCVMYATSINCLFDLYYQVIARSEDEEDVEEEEVDQEELLTTRNIPAKISAMKHDDLRKKLFAGINTFKEHYAVDENQFVTSDVILQQTLAVSGLLHYELDIIPIIEAVNDFMEKRKLEKGSFSWNNDEIELYLQQLQKNCKKLTRLRRSSITYDSQGNISLSLSPASTTKTQKPLSNAKVGGSFEMVPLDTEVDNPVNSSNNDDNV